MQKGDASTVSDAVPEGTVPSPTPELPDQGKLYEPVPASAIPAREATANPEDDVPPLKERFLGVLFSPVETFRKLEARWGWGAPWLAVAACGLAKGVLRIGLADITSIQEGIERRKRELMTEQMRRMYLENLHDEFVPAKSAALLEKAGEVVGPFLGTLVSIVAVGLVLFAAAYFLGGKRDIPRSIVIAAHAKLVMIVGYAVLALATLLGNPMAHTSPANAADMLANPFAFFALMIVDPIAIWHTVLLGIGLSAGLGVSRGRAIAFTAVVQGVAWLAWLGYAEGIAAVTRMQLGQ